jgi:hypothetical protein
MLEEKEKQLKNVEEQLKTEKKQNKLNELEYIKKIAYGGKMGKINVTVDDRLKYSEENDGMNFITELPTENKVINEKSLQASDS